MRDRRALAVGAARPGLEVLRNALHHVGLHHGGLQHSDDVSEVFQSFPHRRGDDWRPVFARMAADAEDAVAIEHHAQNRDRACDEAARKDHRVSCVRACLLEARHGWIRRKVIADVVERYVPQGVGVVERYAPPDHHEHDPHRKGGLRRMLLRTWFPTLRSRMAITLEVRQS